MKLNDDALLARMIAWLPRKPKIHHFKCKIDHF